ncbi:MAG: LacI family DNA-binding transcriptional regulator [Clostridiales bacterium]|nr:LacI family DNA-binding transcriptional regulator [Clostridiales bacterium]
MFREKATIYDVAEKAGVSIATVSRVLNGKDKVSEKTKNKVTQAANELGFQFRQNANPSGINSTTILMCVSNLTNPFNVSVIEGARKSALQHGFDLMILQLGTHYKTLEQYEELTKKQDYAGIIMLNPVRDSSLVLELGKKRPVVMCSEYILHDDLSFVSVDDYTATKTVIKYLLSTGRQKIGLLNGALDYKFSQNREKGYRDALSEAGITVNEAWISHIYSFDFSLAGTYATHLLSQADRPNAIFAISDVFAAAAIKAAKKLGLNVPQDVSVVGFDNMDISLVCDPAITTVRQPSFQIGFQSCELLIEKIKRPDAETKHLLLDTELIIRESTLETGITGL